MVDGNSQELRLGVTTSLRDSGLLRKLLSDYKEDKNKTIRSIAVGSGAAFAIGRRGDVDLLIVHDEQGEKEFINQGYGKARIPWISNDFILIGPIEDRAGVADSRDILAALKAIATRGKEYGDVRFISRGDESGTHKREILLIDKLGINLGDYLGENYIISGQGMGASLNIAINKEAYILSDRGSWLYRKEDVDFMGELLSGGVLLDNPYSVIILNRELDKTRQEEVKNLVAWLFSKRTKAVVENYQIGGENVFRTVGEWPTSDEIAVHYFD